MKYIEFLKEYNKLCQKYGMGLEGCGCCGSPSLEVWENGKQIACVTCLGFDSESNCVTVDDVPLEKYLEKYNNVV